MDESCFDQLLSHLRNELLLPSANCFQSILMTLALPYTLVIVNNIITNHYLMFPITLVPHDDHRSLVLQSDCQTPVCNEEFRIPIKVLHFNNLSVEHN